MNSKTILVLILALCGPIVSAAASGQGDALVMFGLWGIYLPIPFGLGLAAGVALGRLVRAPGQRRGGAWPSRAA